MISPRRCAAVDLNANRCGAGSARRREAMPAHDLQTAAKRADSSALRCHRMSSRRWRGRETVPSPGTSLPVCSRPACSPLIGMALASTSGSLCYRRDLVFLLAIIGI
ncbi:hypothetical protein GQ55_6G278500 [Panicum hallii var. hallii]|uniref:Uncharacterized protein n=1 Tax=Panicum hallii var. hallii TaxID=1504633 RepID=A0A2T7DAF3_9POAL|nr:hypothetical protein GQ55_6G278500 [Panicum hallii var. hallii]